MGITGNALPLVGEQIVEFTLGNRLFRQKFGVCTLPTEADGLLGLNFLSTHGIRLDLASNKLEVQTEALAKPVKESQVETAFTFFPAAEGHGGQSSEPLGEKAIATGQNPVRAQPAPENEIPNSEGWVVKLPKTIKLAPRARQLVAGRLEGTMGSEIPRLVCVEPALLPYTGILVARGVCRPVMREDQNKGPVAKSARSIRSDSPKLEVNLMVVNFSHEEVELPKASVMGIADVVSESLVATVNDGPRVEPKKLKSQARFDQSFKEYLDDKLGHLSEEERSVIEPVLVKYRDTFYVEGYNELKGTDLVRHHIPTGDAQPVRRPPYRVPYALREEVDRQVETMLKRGIIEPSTYRWNFPLDRSRASRRAFPVAQFLLLWPFPKCHKCLAIYISRQPKVTLALECIIYLFI
jgi:hypothetical protein